jgi:Zn-dependent M16 (insulinase) family peptidase
MDKDFINLVRKHLVDSVEMYYVGLQPNFHMSEQEIEEYRKKCIDLARRIREDIK